MSLQLCLIRTRVVYLVHPDFRPVNYLLKFSDRSTRTIIGHFFAVFAVCYVNRFSVKCTMKWVVITKPNICGVKQTKQGFKNNTFVSGIKLQFCKVLYYVVLLKYISSLPYLKNLIIPATWPLLVCSIPFI